MKALIQRVSEASVKADGELKGSCKEGFLILFCSVFDDTEEDISVLSNKVSKLRIFEDENGKMNKSILDIGGEVLCVSQFTLAADTKKGNRPSFINAKEPKTAKEYYDKFCEELKKSGIKRVEKGVFGADMKVSLINDGPVTIMLDTETWRKNET